LDYNVAVIVVFAVTELGVPPLQGRNLSLAETFPDRGPNPATDRNLGINKPAAPRNTSIPVA